MHVVIKDAKGLFEVHKFTFKFTYRKKFRIQRMRMKDEACIVDKGSRVDDRRTNATINEREITSVL